MKKIPANAAFAGGDCKMCTKIPITTTKAIAKIIGLIVKGTCTRADRNRNMKIKVATVMLMIWLIVTFSTATKRQLIHVKRKKSDT